MVKADGTIIINTKIDTSDLKDDAKKIKQGLEGIGDSAEEASGGLGDVFGQMFSASALADVAVGALKAVGEALKDLAIESIEAAADLRAENAQFSETFKELEDTASDSLKAIAKDVGVSASRMKKSYTKSFAFVKSIGADSEEAMDIANRAMLAAADSAAYYDTTIEEATETLQSFLKGNYENDAALGIAATETTRNAKANELYAMSFDKLSESQKVDVLLAMVEAGNKASGALGQAAREADSWTNVTGELQEAWRQLLGVLGDPILDTITPILKGISDAIYSIIEKSDAKKLRESFEGYAEAVAGAQSAFAESSESIDTAAAKAGFYANRLEALEKAGLDTAISQEEYKMVVQELNQLIPGLNLVIDEQTGSLNKNTKEIRANIDAWKKQATAQALQKRFSDVLDAQAEAEADLIVAQAKSNNLSEQAKDIEEQRSAVMAKRGEIVAKIAQLQDKLTKSTSLTAAETQALNSQIEALYWESDSLGREYAELGVQLDDTRNKQAALDDEIERANGVIAAQAPAIQEATDAMDLFNASNTQTGTDVPQSQEQVQTAIQGTLDTVQKLKDEYNSARVTAKESIDSQIGLFDALATESTTTAGEIIKNWEAQQQAFNNYSANLQKAVDMGLDTALVEQLSDGSAQSMDILNALVNDTAINIDEINASFQKVEESRETVAATMADVQTDMSDRLEELKATTETEWGDMAVEVGEAITQMQMEIDSLTGRTVFVDIVERYAKRNTTSSGSTSGSITPTPTAVQAIPYSVPYLAKGAVIPPRSPFYAVLGDQRSGTNVEAPLSTIQEALRLELSDIVPAVLAGFEAVAEKQENILEAISNIEIGDDVIGAAASRYDRRLAVMRGE